MSRSPRRTADRLLVLLLLFLLYASGMFRAAAQQTDAAASRTPDADASPAMNGPEGSREDDPCGFSLRKEGDALVWAYGRDALIVDMQRWALHPLTVIDVIGSSVQRRPLYHMVFTNPASQLKKRRIWFHARTHPIESESSLVARAIVDELLSGSELGRLLLDHAVVHVLPMLNPDGVELQRARENANGVDLESNWGAADAQPEVAALRRHLTALMQSGTPIEVALNLHSAYDCKRYFVYHAAAGTSELFTQLQQRFIGYARARFPGGIQPWDYFVSWTGGTPDRYPESWFWRNYREDVMALTYEDMNCASAGDYDRTARALLGAAADYLGLTGTLDTRPSEAAAAEQLIAGLYPSPVGWDGMVTVRIMSAGAPARVSLHDLLGRELALLYDGETAAEGNLLRIPAERLAAGTYLLRVVSGGRSESRPVLLVR